MRCKPSDLVILSGGGANKAMKHYVGSIRVVLSLSKFHEDAWYLEPPVYGGNKLLASWADENLIPIRDPGEDATDETLQWLDVPTKETA